MSDHAAFLRAIVAKPNDRLPQMIFADWLDEHGRTAEASYWRGERRIPPELDDGDWCEAFGFAGETRQDGDKYRPHNTEPTVSTALPDSGVSTAPFGRRDVKRVVAKVEGENDGPSWVCVGELFDGRYFALSAGCDYTGWD